MDDFLEIENFALDSKVKTKKNHQLFEKFYLRVVQSLR